MTRSLSLLLLLVLSADALLVFLLPVMVYAHTASLAWSGLAYAMTWLPRIGVTPLVGRSIDRWGVRKVSVLSDVLKCAGCLCVVLMLSAAPDALTVTLLGGLLSGLVAIGNTQSLIAYEKMIALVSRDVDRDVNLLCRIDQLAMITGPLCGFLCYAAGVEALLLLAAVLYVSNALCYAFSRAVPDNRCEAARDATAPGPGNLKLILSTPVLVSSVVLAVGNNAFDGLVEAGAVSLIDRAMQLPIEYFAFVDVCAGICGVAATLLYPRLAAAVPALRLFSAAALLTVLASALMILSQAYLPGFLVLYALNIAGKVFMTNFCRGLRIRLVPVERLASVSSLMVLMNQAVLPVVGMTLYLLGEQARSLSVLLLAAIAISVLGAWKVRAQAGSRPVIEPSPCMPVDGR
ncbi:MFS transporter [Pseudomonas sp. REB1044]|uniref:MFS transporter n=1 Tax=Pseudomonas sp. REB1044 TaxID=2675224 RepID=UPI00315CB249